MQDTLSQMTTIIIHYHVGNGPTETTQTVACKGTPGNAKYVTEILGVEGGQKYGS